MRLFISIDFPDDVLQEIHSWFPDLKGWRKTSIHQMHLTLAFLGECSEKEKKEIHSELSAIQFSGFEITMNRLGAFPNEASPRIIWAGVRQNDDLMNLQHEISTRLKSFLRSDESHEYIPHITLARKKSKKGINHIVKQQLKSETPLLNAYIKEFHLKESHLKRNGSEHEILHHYVARSNS